MINFIFVFSVGTILASFLNVVATSLPMKENWINRRSACPKCKEMLKPYQLLPIISYVVQKGKCSGCKCVIPTRYPLTEIAGGALAVVPLFLGDSYVGSARIWIFFALLFTVTLTDLYYRLVPNKILLFFGVPLFFISDHVLPAFFGFLFFLFADFIGRFLFKKETIGGGDIKLYFVIGLVLGIQQILYSIFISSALALLYLLLFAKDKSAPIPFVPFIATGSILSLLFF